MKVLAASTLNTSSTNLLTQISTLNSTMFNKLAIRTVHGFSSGGSCKTRSSMNGKGHSGSNADGKWHLAVAGTFSLFFSKINGILVQQCVEFMNLQEDNCM